MPAFALVEDHYKREQYRTGLQDVLQPYQQAYLMASPQERRGFADNVLGAARDHPDLAVLLLSFLFDLTKDAQYVPLLVKAVAACGALPPAQHYNLFLHLSHLFMMNRAAFSVEAYGRMRQKLLKPLYARLFRRIEKAQVAPIAPYKPDPKKVLVITNVMNNPRMTGPLWDVLEYAHALKTEFGMEPLVFNSNIWLQEMGAALWPLRCYATPPGKQRDVWPHRGGALPLFRLWEPWPDQAALQDFNAMVMAERPALAITIGDMNCYTELLARHIPAYVMHFTVDFPVTLHSRPAYHPGLPETAPALLKAAGYPDAAQKLVKLVPSYSVPGKFARYARRDFGIAGKAFVYAIVGHRLDSEVTHDFLMFLEQVARAVPRGFFIFMGLFTSYKRRIAAYAGLAGRTAFVGNVGDVPSFMAIVDCYLNPDRAGGGSSAVYALAAGVPVLTLPHGDVAFAAGNTRYCADYDALRERAIALARVPAALQEARALALARARLICQRNVNMHLLLKDAGIRSAISRRSARGKTRSSYSSLGKRDKR